MTFNPTTWQPIAIVLSGLNLVAAGYAAAVVEPLHATAHAGGALAFGWWARRMQQAPASREHRPGAEELEAEIGELQRELNETQDRLDFAERLLAQEQAPRRVGPEL